MPNSFLIRPAELSDSEGIAQVHTRSWQRAYRGLLPNEFLDNLRWQDRKVRWDAILKDQIVRNTFVVIGPENVIVGFASTGPCRDDDLKGKDIFELYAIYLSPEVWGIGIGAKLFNNATREIPIRFHSLSVWVLKENFRGRNFYENQGFEVDGATKMADIDGHQLEEVRYRIPLPIHQGN